MKGWVFVEVKNYHDNRLINKDTYLYYANTNEAHLSLPVKGIVVEFPGLGGSSCLGGSIDRGSYSTPYTMDFGRQGILCVYIFPGPWSWGNKGAVRIADAIVLALAEKYQLEEAFPLAVCGGSMGGLGTLNYAADSQFTVRIAAAACPCVDAMEQMYCNPDFPRTYICAVAGYDMELEDALKEISPLYRVSDMPKTSYFICSNGTDQYFPQAQCDTYVEKLVQAGHTVEYHAQPNTTHGQFFPEVRQRLHQAIVDAILGS